MYQTKPVARAVSIALAASSLGVSPTLLAQDVAADDEGPIEEITTTGSRIRKDGFSSASPMDVVLTSAAAPTGMANLAELLQTTTVAAGAPQITAATSTAFVQNGGAGVNTLSLRGLGANRTLTLINGRRAGPAGTRGGVSSFDLNVIPLAAIERIEILKDGASSIYGSDAIADWPLLNALLNTASGATWVSIHHGGGVGIGLSLHAGMVIVADGTPEAARRLERVLTNDPGIGVIRHLDAGYEEAGETARTQGLRIPMAEKE